MAYSSSDQTPKLTMKERAKKARYDAYVAAKDRRKNDPRMAELKARMKAARREASAQAKERRETTRSRSLSRRSSGRIVGWPTNSGGRQPRRTTTEG